MKGYLGRGRPAEREKIRKLDQVPEVVGIRKPVIPEQIWRQCRARDRPSRDCPTWGLIPDTVTKL